MPKSEFGGHSLVILHELNILNNLSGLDVSILVTAVGEMCIAATERAQRVLQDGRQLRW
jgi:hypothetical protein